MWIVNLQDGVVEVYSERAGSAYRHVHVLARSATLELPAGLTGTLAVDEVLGEEVKWEEE